MPTRGTGRGSARPGPRSRWPPTRCRRVTDRRALLSSPTFRGSAAHLSVNSFIHRLSHREDRRGRTERSAPGEEAAGGNGRRRGRRVPSPWTPRGPRAAAPAALSAAQRGRRPRRRVNLHLSKHGGGKEGGSPRGPSLCRPPAARAVGSIVFVSLGLTENLAQSRGAEVQVGSDLGLC